MNAPRISGRRPGAVRQRLREATQALHAALESGLGVAAERPSAADYGRHLGLLAGFSGALEARLRDSAAADDLRRLGWRDRAHLARADLEGRPEGLAAADPTRLDGRPGAADPAGREGPAVAAALPRVEGRPEALGAAWVLAGSGLGARVLLMRLRAAGVLPGPFGSRYLESHDAAWEASWRALCAELETLEDGDVARAIDAARDTFAALGSWRRTCTTA